MRVICGLIALSLLLAACGDDTGAVVLDAADSGTTIQADVGDIVVIELESNPSTGYSWILPVDLGILDLVDERWVGDSDLTGSPGTTHLEFEVVGTGTWTLDLEYRRPWEDAAPDRTFAVTIVAA